VLQHTTLSAGVLKHTLHFYLPEAPWSAVRILRYQAQGFREDAERPRGGCGKYAVACNRNRILSPTLSLEYKGEGDEGAWELEGALWKMGARR
jgi:hypothetical protein